MTSSLLNHEDVEGMIRATGSFEERALIALLWETGAGSTNSPTSRSGTYTAETSASRSDWQAGSPEVSAS